MDKSLEQQIKLMFQQCESVEEVEDLEGIIDSLMFYAEERKKELADK